MTDQERLAKLEQAVGLLREVEFSYAEDSPERRNWFRWTSQNYSFLGFVGANIYALKRAIRYPGSV